MRDDEAGFPPWEIGLATARHWAMDWCSKMGLPGRSTLGEPPCPSGDAGRGLEVDLFSFVTGDCGDVDGFFCIGDLVPFVPACTGLAPGCRPLWAGKPCCFILPFGLFLSGEPAVAGRLVGLGDVRAFERRPLPVTRSMAAGH